MSDDDDDGVVNKLDISSELKKRGKGYLYDRVKNPRARKYLGLGGGEGGGGGMAAGALAASGIATGVANAAGNVANAIVGKEEADDSRVFAAEVRGMSAANSEMQDKILADKLRTGLWKNEEAAQYASNEQIKQLVVQYLAQKNQERREGESVAMGSLGQVAMARMEYGARERGDQLAYRATSERNLLQSAVDTNKLMSNYNLMMQRMVNEEKQAAWGRGLSGKERLERLNRYKIQTVQDRDRVAQDNWLREQMGYEQLRSQRLKNNLVESLFGSIKSATRFAGGVSPNSAVLMSSGDKRNPFSVNSGVKPKRLQYHGIRPR